MPRSPAISFKLFQNWSSRLTLVLWPAMTIERFETEDFTASPPVNQRSVLYDRMAFGQENRRLGATGGFPAEAVSPSAVWRRVTCRGYEGLGTARIIATRGRIAIGTALEPFA